MTPPVNRDGRLQGVGTWGVQARLLLEAGGGPGERA
jgi:hypothetical protein